MQYLLYEFYIFLVWLLSFQSFVWLFQVRSNLYPSAEDACVQLLNVQPRACRMRS